MTAWGWLKLLLMDFEWSALSPPPVLEASHPISMYILCLQLAGSCSPVYQLTHNQMGSYLNLGKASPTSWIWSITTQTPLPNEVTHLAESRVHWAAPRTSPSGGAFMATLCGTWKKTPIVCPKDSRHLPPALHFNASNSCRGWFMGSAARYVAEGKWIHEKGIGETSYSH